MSHALGYGTVELLDRTQDGKHVLAALHDGGLPLDYWLLDRSGGKTTLKPVVRTYEGIDDAHTAPVSWIKYTARDGTSIPALLTLPPGKPQGKLPFVILPHGGPTAHDSLGFDWIAQFIASRGYGVLQPQFRASTGFGRALLEGGVHQWGAAVQNDITDGTRYLIANHLADPAKIAIAGASFGGYSALEGVEREPGLYRGAVAFAPVTDYPRLVGGPSVFGRGDVYIPPAATARELAAASPVNGVDKISVPVLLVHGRQDFTVPVSQTDEMKGAMRRANKQVEAIYLDGSDHFMSNSTDRLVWLQAMERFLHDAIGPGKTS